MSNISPQKTWDEMTMPEEPLSLHGNRLMCVEPDYEQWIDVRNIRRMSRIIKMGVAGAIMALKDAGIEKPDAIITGTGLGCLEDTGNFLSKMIEKNEQALNPTPFMQSTHNTIGSQIALILQCQGHNQTFTHDAFSFESALLDAILLVAENPQHKILVGGVDEITEFSHAIHSRFNIFRKGLNNSLDLFESPGRGVLHGEGSVWFALSGQRSDHDRASIQSITTFYKPEAGELKTRIESFLTQVGTSSDEIDLVLLGKAGDERYDHLPESTVAVLFPESSIGLFKHLCGEYPVASAFALWLGAGILDKNHIPASVMHKNKGRSLQQVLIYNQYFGTHHSLILLGSCRGT